MKKEVFLGLLVSLFLVGCNRSRQEQTERFSVATIQPKPVSETASLRKFPFLAKPYHETELAFRINGPLTGFSVRSGQYFRKGQVILELDKRDFRIRLQRCEAVLQQKEAEYKRVAALYAKQNISGTAYEAVKAAYEVARSNYDEARNALTDTDLRAPFDGFVQEVYVEPYQEVRSAQSVLSFVETDKLIAEVFVPQDVALAFLQQTDDWKKQVKICFDIAKDSVLVPSDCFLSKTTAYPGASASEVQQQVTDILEESIQSLGELYYLKTENRAGLSKITVYTKKEIRADEMQQLWDKLRRKVADVQNKLPEGAGPSLVNDDFGDVLGVFYGIYGSQATNRELEAVSRRLKNELLQVEDVARVEICGVQTPTIELEIEPSVMTRTGITQQELARAFEKQNKMVDAGSWKTGNARLRVDVKDSFTTLEEIEDLTVTCHEDVQPPPLRGRASWQGVARCQCEDVSGFVQTPADGLFRLLPVPHPRHGRGNGGNARAAVRLRHCRLHPQRERGGAHPQTGLFVPRRCAGVRLYVAGIRHTVGFCANTAQLP